MGQSTVVEWLNENEQRAYPLTQASERMIDVNGNIDLYRLFLDANFVYKDDVMPEEVRLTQIISVADNLIFSIEGLPDFSINDPVDPAIFPMYLRNSNNDLLVIGDEAVALYQQLPESYPLTPNVSFEPSVAIELQGPLTGVNTVTFSTIVKSNGDIEITEGYQTDIQIEEQTVRLEVGRGSGLPLPCSNFFPSLPQDCDEVISFINGVTPRQSGGKVTFQAGNHINIFEDQERARIYIGLDFEAEDICEIPTLPPQP